ncbi:MAG: hypothetical protein MPJ24_05920 [Pirellulaceae bacterium]|nr:hypothetical protein [Pirellulaceae bacterium]
MAETLASYLALPIVAACFGFLITYVVGIEVPKAILSSVIYFVLLIGLQFVLSILFTSVDANATAMLSRL